VGGAGAFDGVPSSTFDTDLVTGCLAPFAGGGVCALTVAPIGFFPGTLDTENGDCFAIGVFLVGGAPMGAGFFKLNGFKFKSNGNPLQSAWDVFMEHISELIFFHIPDGLPVVF
jgi:hypothetical protein